jgi:hypothetical protein
VNSQDKMNAAGEFLLDRVRSALQDERGVQFESLLTCLGALAGYACQVSVRQQGAALVAVKTTDGSTYLYGDALNAPLAESPLSVWAFVAKAVQKSGAPLPELAEIFAHVTKTVGTSEFGVPRAADANRPRDLPLVYLRQLWPQVLPIAQRACEKPVQLPVVFAIALQRAIEQATGVIDTTLGARIAMESAVAMSKVVLPDAATQPKRPAAAKARIDVARPQVGNLPPGLRIATIVLIAIIGAGGAIWRADLNAKRTAEREERELAIRKWNESLRELERAAQEAQAVQDRRKATAPVETPPAAPTPYVDDKQFETVRLPDGSTATQLRD